jgi:predicted RNA binding protein YcfA (HicA-like mRNA interferase family)
MSHAEGAWAIRLVERDGWVLTRINGSHRIYHHPTKPGIVVVAGHAGDDVATGTWLSILRQAGLK